MLAKYAAKTSLEKCLRHLHLLLVFAVHTVAQCSYRYSDRNLTLIYDGGEKCSSNFARRTVINFHCDPNAGDVPEFKENVYVCVFVCVCVLVFVPLLFSFWTCQLFASRLSLLADPSYFVLFGQVDRKTRAGRISARKTVAPTSLTGTPSTPVWNTLSAQCAQFRTGRKTSISQH